MARSLLNPGQGGAKSPVVKIRGKSIKYSMKMNYLGVRIEAALRIKSHIEVVGKKADKLMENLQIISITTVYLLIVPKYLFKCC